MSASVAGELTLFASRREKKRGRGVELRKWIHIYRYTRDNKRRNNGGKMDFDPCDPTTAKPSVRGRTYSSTSSTSSSSSSSSSRHIVRSRVLRSVVFVKHPLFPPATPQGPSSFHCSISKRSPLLPLRSYSIFHAFLTSRPRPSPTQRDKYAGET